MSKIVALAHAQDDARQDQDAAQASGPSWPEPLAPEALSGLAGHLVNTILPHTEADPAALLFTFLTMYGNAVGRTAYAVAEADRHHMNLFSCLVGATAKGRKGTSFGRIASLFGRIDETWHATRIVAGMASGEGLLWAVRDPIYEIQQNKKTGETAKVLLDAGISDKRLLADEAEFASVIRVFKRDGNTLSAVVRKAWDSGDLSTLTKNSPARASGAHISILAHITRDELLRYFEDTETANGFGNRFLWVCVRRSKCLPEGGSLREADLAEIVRRLQQAVAFAQHTGEIRRDSAARELWSTVYPTLSEGKPGLFGSMTGRAEAQVLRLSSIYALLDLSAVVRAEHLLAALACWQYAENSARFIFGDALGDSTADEVLKLLKGAGAAGMTRTELSNHFGRHKPTHSLTRSLNMLAERGLARVAKEQGPGRPVERWFSL